LEILTPVPNYVAFFYEIARGWDALQSQRHITSTATEEIKLDGYRALAFKTGGKLQLRSRNDNDFALRYPSIAKALASLPDDTAVDGEIVALDAEGKPSFNALQNYGSSKADLIFYIFDVMVLAGKDVMGEPLRQRRELLENKVLTKLDEPIRYSPALEASLADLVHSVKGARV
jgi:ATP-dependent DNA ligase